VSSERGISSESQAREGRESGFATAEQHRNREKGPSLTLNAKSEDAICKAGCTRIQENNEPQTTFKARLASPPKPCNTRPHRIIARSRERFATSRGQVETRIQRWLQRH
jgi:hypothetical protein